MSEANATAESTKPSYERLIKGLQNPAAFYGIEADRVEMCETHISWVFLVGEYAFKIKKPIRTDFLDYSTLEKRKHYCDEELRLDRRYAPELYLEVVPIIVRDGVPIVGDEFRADHDRVIDYAVKMRRFPDDALLSTRIGSGALTTDEVFALAQRVADFHQSAARIGGRPGDEPLGSIDLIFQNAADNFLHLRSIRDEETARTVRVLAEWTRGYFDERRQVFTQRLHNGFVRECHGDMHLANIVHWNDRLIPFDGIEFNDSFRWIDVINDAAFVAMDFAARGRLDLCRSFINAYLEHTGDHASLGVLRWYLVFRALVRAKVAAIRVSQSDLTASERTAAEADCRHYVDLAYQFSLPDDLAVWITHGVSGSGKTTISELIVQSRGAIRLRSDIERKRHFGMQPTDRPVGQKESAVYCESATRATYARLLRMARCILRAGYPVVVDATFLCKEQRQAFQSLANREGAAFGILVCHASEATLRQRIADRVSREDDASDADWTVLENQLANMEPLTEQENESVVEIPDLSSVVDSME